LIAQYGPVHVFNPQQVGAVSSTFCWSPIEGCEDPATAIRRADAFAVSQKGSMAPSAPNTFPHNRGFVSAPAAP
jgi:hypothetical protein